MLAIDHKQQIPGRREHSLDYDGLFYMFASEATLQQFTANPARYAAGARQAMGLPRGRLVRKPQAAMMPAWIYWNRSILSIRSQVVAGQQLPDFATRKNTQLDFLIQKSGIVERRDTL